MKKFLVLITFIAVLLTACSANKNITSKDFTEEQLDSSKYDVEKYTTPFWKGNIVYNECVFPIMNENNELVPFELMYDADEIISVRDYTLEKEYIEGIDYKLENGKLIIIPTGEIKVKMQDDIHHKENPNNYSSTYMFPHKNGEGFEFCNDRDTFYRSLFVTYTHSDEWDGPKIKKSVEKLDNTIKKLNNGEKLNIVVTGDSISVGYNSSRIESTPPYADGYALMAVKALREKYDSDIKFINSAVGGSKADFNADQLEKQIYQYNPSLCIIAYGMNDGMVDVPSFEYKKNIEDRIKLIKENLPDCEILLVTPFYANPNVSDTELYKEYAKCLYEIEASFEGVGLCDPQSFQEYLMEEKDKDFLCFMSDNLVHPNDYGMRIIAQCVLEALGAV